MAKVKTANFKVVVLAFFLGVATVTSNSRGYGTPSNLAE